MPKGFSHSASQLFDAARAPFDTTEHADFQLANEIPAKDLTSERPISLNKQKGRFGFSSTNGKFLP
jgi:hypothetical protein